MLLEIILIAVILVVGIPAVAIFALLFYETVGQMIRGFWEMVLIEPIRNYRQKHKQPSNSDNKTKGE